MMANFDPQVQPEGDNPFIYGFGARPIQQPRPNQAGEILGKTIGKSLDEAGKMVSGGTNLAMNVTKQNIDEGLHSQYDPVQSAWVNRLSQVDDVLKKNPNALDLANSNYPEDIKKLPGMVDQLISLRDNGKVSPTYLDMQRDAIAKGMRAKYPGMRDVIDQEFSRMTREDPANQVISQLTNDINAYAAAAKTKQDKVGNFILSKGVGTGIVDPQMYQAYLKNPQAMGDKLMGLIYQHNRVDLDLRDDDLRLRNQQAHNALDKEEAGRTNESSLDKMLSLQLQKMQINIPGLGPEGISDTLNNLDKLDDATRVQVGQAFRAAGVAWANQARNWGMQPIDPNNPKSLTRSSIQGADNFEKAVEEKAKYFDNIADLILKDKVGLAYSQSQFLQATTNTEAANAVKNIPGLAALVALGKIAPNSSYTNKFFQNFYTDDKVDAAMQPYVTGRTGQMVTQPDVTTTGVPFTLSNALDDAAAKGLNTPQWATANQAIISGLIWTMTQPDSPPVIKKNAANAVYSDPDTITKVNDSKVDARGNVTPGKSTYLAQTVNTQTTNAVKKMADPEITQKYIQTAKKGVGIVIRSEINQLNQIEDNPDFHIGWDNRRNQFSIQIPTKYDAFGQPLAGSHVYKPGLYNQVNDSVKKINMALRSLVDVNSKLTHEDVSDFLAQFFVESGMDPRLIRNTIGGKFIKALIASQEKNDRSQ